MTSSFKNNSMLGVAQWLLATRERHNLAVLYMSALQKGRPVSHTFPVFPAMFACT